MSQAWKGFQSSMGQENSTQRPYFPFAFPLSRESWENFSVAEIFSGKGSPTSDEPSFQIRQLADSVNSRRTASFSGDDLPAETLLALRTINQALRHVAHQYFLQENPGSLDRGRQVAEAQLGPQALDTLYHAFVELFPPVDLALHGQPATSFLQKSDTTLSGIDQTTVEMVLLFLNTSNPAARPARVVFDDQKLRQKASYIPFITQLEEFLEEKETAGLEGQSLFHLLRSPMLASPNDLAGQIEHIRANWGHLLPDELIQRLQLALDQLEEMDSFRQPEYGPPPVLEFGPGQPGWQDNIPEPEAFSTDAAWMSNVVLMAKSVHVWLDQLSRWHGRSIDNLAAIPDEELDRLARWGVTGLWLIGLWERSEASRLIKQYMGNPDAAASAYALRDYHIAQDLGGHDAYENLRHRAEQRGIRLASDMVPNHMGIDSRWVMENPHWFLQSDHPPFPGYSFTGGDLSDNPDVSIRIEDGYWNQSDAAVVFQRVENSSGRACYIYHGNDGTSMPWNDTAQLNFMIPEVREAVVQVILQVARMFPIIRFDAAMTLAKKHFQRLWFPAPGDAGAIPSRAEHGLTKPQFDDVFPVEFWREVVDRVAQEVPDTLLLAEAFWLMEGYFVRTLGMHRVYNSAFMNMLKMEDNEKYRQTLKNVLEFSPPILQRFVNFMNNPDEKTAVEQFGRGDKYFGCALLLVTMPGLPMLGHGQIEGFSEKYGMEYRRAMWEESIDQDMVHRHEREIFPLMRRRSLFSGAENFALFDFQTDGGWVDENVYAFSNRVGDQRGLIIFNNSYEKTSGRLQHSSAINVGTADHPHLEKRTLAEALQLQDNHQDWVIYRDHIDGKEYLRSCRELMEQGLHTEMRGYQYRALLDFRIVSGQDEKWARLAHYLQGGGTDSIELAMRRLELAPVLDTLLPWVSNDILAWFETLWLEGEEAEPFPLAATELPDSIANLLVEMKSLSTFTPEQKLGPRTARDLNELLAGLPGSRILQAIYISRCLRLLPGPWTESETLEINGHQITPDDFPLIRDVLVNRLKDWTGHDFAGWSTASLSCVLAQHTDVIPKMAAGQAQWFAKLLEDKDVTTFLGLNFHEGHSWLRKEPLELLLDALAISTLLGRFSDNPANFLDSRAIIQNLALQASFQMERFQDKLKDF